MLDLFKSGSPDAEELEELFLDVVGASKTVKVLIDGLDECSRPARMVVLKLLSRLVSAQTITKVFLSSRDSMIGDIAIVFETCVQLCMGCEEARGDLSLYVNGVIEDKIEAGELEVGSVQLVQDIRSTLIQESNGMFLWVAFQIEDLCRQKSDAEIRHTLKTLPKDLPEPYQRALSRIIKDGNQKLANQIFRWVATAKRPLRLEELREAIAVVPGDEFLDRERLVNNADSLTTSCGDLIVSDDEDVVVQFVHHTVQEFLISKDYQIMANSFHFDLSEVDLIAGEIYVTYLNFNDFKRQLIPRQRPIPIIQPSNILESPALTGQGRMAEYGLKFARIVAKRSKTKFDIVRHLDTIASLERDDSLQLQVQYAFLAYARSFWLSNTKTFSKAAPAMMNIWRQLITTNHQVAPQPWFGEDGVFLTHKLLDYILEESLHHDRLPSIR